MFYLSLFSCSLFFFFDIFSILSSKLSSDIFIFTTYFFICKSSFLFVECSFYKYTILASWMQYLLLHLLVGILTTVLLFVCLFKCFSFGIILISSKLLFLFCLVSVFHITWSPKMSTILGCLIICKWG